MSFESFPGRGPERDWFERLGESFGEGRERLVAELAEHYSDKARLDPEGVTALELRLLRRSPWDALRAAAVLIWSRRRPGAFLRAAPGFLAGGPATREAVAEGLANAAILCERTAEDPEVARLLAACLADPEPNVRELAEQARLLLTPGADAT